MEMTGDKKSSSPHRRSQMLFSLNISSDTLAKWEILPRIVALNKSDTSQKLFQDRSHLHHASAGWSVFKSQEATRISIATVSSWFEQSAWCLGHNFPLMIGGWRQIREWHAGPPNTAGPPASLISSDQTARP